jgi:DNA-binding MarR family transcriptional regulator
MSTYRGLHHDREHPWRTDNLGRLLLIALNVWQEELVRRLRQRGFRDVATTHMNLMRHVDMNGTRVTELSERAGVTKQAISQLVANCEANNFVVTKPDPTDGRAKLVLFTQVGRRVMLAQQAVLADLDRDLDTTLGAEEHRRLRLALAAICDTNGDLSGRPPR